VVLKDYVVTEELAKHFDEALMLIRAAVENRSSQAVYHPSVIEPDVLSKDRDKFETSGDDRYVDKAHRRGKIGWNVGRRIEVAPHYRRPHMVLVWTGVGRAIRRLVGG
jgi:hypothetical protein